MSIRGNGSSGYLERSASLPTAGAFTICGWVQIRLALSHTWQPAFSVGNNGGNPTCLVGNSDAAGLSNWGIYNRADTSSVAFATTPAVGDTVFLALMCNGTNLLGRQRFRDAPRPDFETASGTAPTGTVNRVRVLNTTFDGTDYASHAIRNVKCWNRALTDAQLDVEAQFEDVIDARDLNFHWRLRNIGDFIDRGFRGRHGTRSGTLTDFSEFVRFRKPFRPPRMWVDAAAAGGGAARGIAFGNQGSAFNGGRTFIGPIR